MKTYSHDYTLPARAEQLLYCAQRHLSNDCIAAAKECIQDARFALYKYLSQDNMVPDDDCADGWVKQIDVEHAIHDDH